MTPPPEGLSPEKRAEKLLLILCEYLAHVYGDIHLKDSLQAKDIIAAQIREAEQEEHDRVRVQHAKDLLTAHAEGFREAKRIMIRENGNDYIQTGETVEELVEDLEMDK